MNTDFVSIDDAAIEELMEKTLRLPDSEPGTLLPETILPVNKRFGIADLWKIRNTKRYFSIYR